MIIRTERLFLFVPSLLGLMLLTSSSAQAECGSDAECKGDRVCQSGFCVDRPAPPPPSYVLAPSPPPPAPPPPPWAYSPLHGARSYGSFGAVGDFLAPTFGGVSLEAESVFRLFDHGGIDGGLTLNILDDFGLESERYPLYASVQGGLGFDIGLFRFLQFGPRVNIGYGSDVSGTIELHGAFVAIGAHIIAWVGPRVGFFLEMDGLAPMSSNAPAGLRLAGGLCFAWGY